MYGNEAQGLIINLLAETLNCAFNIHILSRENYILESYKPTSQNNQKALLEVNLFFRPGHYDLCY